MQNTVQNLIDELADISCDMSGSDRVWHILFPGYDRRWYHLYVNCYQKVYQISRGDGNILEFKAGKSLQSFDTRTNSFCPIVSDSRFTQTWKPFLLSAMKWLGTVRKDWISANRRVCVEYPLNRRYGVVPHSVIRALLKDSYRLDKELGRKDTKRFVRLIEDGYFQKAGKAEVSSMTAKEYFKYCRIAYIAGKRKEDAIDESLSGREMYRRYADGRHDGLLDIDPFSSQEFADWIDGKHTGKQIGGHPWEIKRGGNTTHIDLSVFRPFPQRKETFKVELRGEAIGRMAETIRMFLAIQSAGLPISIANPEGVRKRLLAQDNIGVIPENDSLHRANQHFPVDQDVFDVMHYDDFGRFKRRINPFITWEPLPVSKPQYL